jgi:hypothetical protein
MKESDKRYRFTERFFWLVLGTACAVAGWELLMILVR